MKPMQYKNYAANIETAKRNETPQQPLSGQMTLNISPNLHAHATMLAAAQGKTLNQKERDAHQFSYATA